MEVILHIGTHKTGTSALQVCLRRNEKALAESGICYARMRPHKHCNGLARLVAKQQRFQARAFVHEQLEQAELLGARTVIMSAESFYAMTLFFHRFNGRRSENYWALEAEAIECLAAAFPSNITPRVVVFFRRQDRFLESLYRQMVIAPRALAMQIDEFAVFASEAMDYWHHMELWSARFRYCATYTYEQLSDSISVFFLRNVIGIERLEDFEGLRSRVNTRLNRDVIEYKLRLNRLPGSSTDRWLHTRACFELERIAGDDGRYASFLTPQARSALLTKFEPGNALLHEKFGTTPFPAVDDEGSDSWESYPGLSSERALELAERHARIKRNPGYAIERSLLSARKFLQRRLPMFGRMIPIGTREYLKTALSKRSKRLPRVLSISNFRKVGHGVLNLSVKRNWRD